MKTKEKDRLSDTLTNEQRMQLVSLKMVVDADFFDKARAQLYALEMLASCAMQLNDDLQESYYPLLVASGEKRFIQLIQNATNAIYRLCNEVARMEERAHRDKYSKAYNDVWQNGEALSHLLETIIRYMAEEQDIWRWYEIRKKIDELVPQSAKDARNKMISEMVDKIYPQYADKKEAIRAKIAELEKAITEQ